MAKIWGDAGKAMTPMSFGKSFDRMQGQPLDKSAVITDTTFAAAYAKAETFAASDNAYVGMILSVSDGTTTKFYGVVNEAGDLEEVGSNIELDTSLEAEGKAADAKAVGDAINQLSSEIAGGGGVGEATEDGGEIFNDYTANKALAPYTKADGSCSRAGSYGYHT